MAKKSTNGTPGSAAPRRARIRKTKQQPAAAPVDVASLTPVEPLLDTANDSADYADASAPESPSYDDIAQEAYQRYLSRGGEHGRDFDDWIEAERALTNRRT